MSYVGNGEASGILRAADAIEAVQIRLSTARYVAPGSLTAGRYGLFRWDMRPKAGGASSHFHRTFSESFYVLSGTILLYDGRDWTEGRGGDFLYIPEGGIHGFRNESDEPASMLILFAPGPPREEYFNELARISAEGRTLTDEEWADLYARHDQTMVEA
jgi:mannose-6-phosphate isomerase-like protein (cupin superfamily)